METPKALSFIGEQLRGGAWAKLAEIAMEGVEPNVVTPPQRLPQAAIYYFPEKQDGTPPQAA